MTAAPDTTPHVLNRALPGWAVDTIRDGIKYPTYRSLYGAVIRIAMSCAIRGWTENQYTNEVADTHSRLWAQMLTDKDGQRQMSLRAGRKMLAKAWAVAVEDTGELGTRDRDAVRAAAVELAYQWSDRLGARSDSLRATDAAVMAWVVAETERRGMFRVTCPRRAVAEGCGIGEDAARGALERLTARGLLVKHSAGRSGDPQTRRAAIYGLPVLEVGGGERGGVPPIEPGRFPMGGPEGSGELPEVLADGTGVAAVSGARDKASGTPHRTVQTVPAARKRVTRENSARIPA